jgi:hypothetical protein
MIDDDDDDDDDERAAVSEMRTGHHSGKPATNHLSYGTTYHVLELAKQNKIYTDITIILPSLIIKVLQ